VGKTTILLQLAQTLLRKGHPARSIFYVSLDHPILKLISLSKILEIYHEEIHPADSPATLLLDEVQYASDWDLHVKQLIDRHRGYRIVATGSASVVQHDRLVDSGVGRWTTVPVPTLSFFEFLHIRGERPPGIPERLKPVDLFKKSPGELALIAEQFRPTMPLFRHYLLVGGFPETARHPDVSFCQRLLREDIVDRVLKRDMTALFGIRNVNDLERLFIYLCGNTGGIFSVQTCASEMGVAAATVSNHLDALEKANLIHRLKPRTISGKKVLKMRYKIYVVDAALCNAVLLRGEEVLDNSILAGAIVETTILRHLYAFHYADTPEILYWRDAKTDREVDIVVQSPSYVLPVEVKYQSGVQLDSRDGLVIFCHAEKPRWAYCITQSDSDFGLTRLESAETSILRVPAHIFTYLIGQAERVR